MSRRRAPAYIYVVDAITGSLGMYLRELPQEELLDSMAAGFTRAA